MHPSLKHYYHLYHRLFLHHERIHTISAMPQARDHDLDEYVSLFDRESVYIAVIEVKRPGFVFFAVVCLVISGCFIAYSCLLFLFSFAAKAPSSNNDIEKGMTGTLRSDFTTCFFRTLRRSSAKSIGCSSS
mmetsp:Transcript_17394/g.28458  ORF Transcript_17394/g.28458 Transcript_17394/m.28458 type:complete len:131 (-) Transcript_17394:143-535(-)